MDNYEEIYDQAGFFADVWEQLPEAFKKPLKPWSETITSHSMIIWDVSSDESIKIASENMCPECRSKNFTDDGICFKCKDCKYLKCEM